MSIDERRLRYFVAVAQAGSLSGAARELRIAQPALSRHVRLLEQSLGRPLLIRSADGISLTSEGERLFRSARKVILDFDKLIDEFGGKTREVERISFGVPPAISAVFSEVFLKAAAKRAPKLHIHLVESLSKFLRSSIEGGELDFAMSYDEVANPNYRLVPLLDEALCVIGAPSAALPNTETIEFSELDRLVLVMKGRTHAVRHLLEETAASRGMLLKIGWEADSLPVVKSLISDGTSHVVSTRSAYVSELASGKLRAVELINPSLGRRVSLAIGNTINGTARQQAVTRLAFDVSKQLVDDGRWDGRLMFRESQIASREA